MPSTVIAKIEYDEVTEVLSVRFVSGTVYEYLNVPKETYAAMRSAFSKGNFLNSHIKGRFLFRKIASPPAKPGDSMA